MMYASTSSSCVVQGYECECRGCHVTYNDAVIMRDDVELFGFYVRHGVFREVSSCDRCGREVVLNRDTMMFRCNRLAAHSKKKKVRCEWMKSVKKGTFLEYTHLSFNQVLVLVAGLLWLEPPRQTFLCKNLKVVSNTVVDWYSFCREVFVDHGIRSSVKLGGPGCTVEIDEAKFGKRKYNRGRRVEGQWVFGGVERGSGKSFFVPVQTRDRTTLLAILKEWVLPGTTVYSDCWKAYDCLNDEGYQHLSVNHSVNFVDPHTGCHTNTIERAWREVRTKVPRYGIRKDHFSGYLAEYQFKRKYPDLLDRVHHFFIAAAQLYSPT